MKKRIGKVNKQWLDLDNHQFCASSEHTLGAGGKPQYNVLPTNSEVQPCRATPNVCCILTNHEYRIKANEKRLQWQEINDEPEE